MIGSDDGTSGQRLRLYRHVAQRLTAAIGDGSYAVGERLPAERDLAVAFAVSRATIREAIIALELAGLVEVRIGAGVYVVAALPKNDTADLAEIGAFELTEARLLFEGEVAALAATLITDAEVAELEALLAEMAAANAVGRGEIADRQFHQLIADATRNSAIAKTVADLWDAREASAQCRSLFQKSRDSGIAPVIREHQVIVDALKARDPRMARAAMRSHLNRVLNYLLDATESEAVERARAKAAADRSRFVRDRLA